MFLAHPAGHRTNRILLAVILASCLGMPLPLSAQSSQPPGTIFGLYQGKAPAPGLGPDRVRVSRAKDNQVTLDVKLYFGHGDVCQIRETGPWTGKSVLVRAEG